MEPPAARRKTRDQPPPCPRSGIHASRLAPPASPCITFFPQHPASAEDFVIHSHQAIAPQPLQAGHLNKITVIVAKRDQAGSCATLEEVQLPAWFYMMFRNKTLSYFVQLPVSPQNPPPWVLYYKMQLPGRPGVQTCITNISRILKDVQQTIHKSSPVRSEKAAPGVRKESAKKNPP